MFDTTLAVSRMIFDGFFDRYPKLKLIASHGGGTLPYIAGRLDICHANMPACTGKHLRAAELLPEEDLIYDSALSFHAVKRWSLRSKVGGESQRPLRLRLPAQHRRHEGLPRAGRRAAAGHRATRCAAATPCASSL